MAPHSKMLGSPEAESLGVVGDYTLLERIGAGGMAEVFKARRTGPEGFQKIVVVKTILPAYAENRSFVSMLISEATVSAALHHSNIVQVYDLGEVDGLPFIAMEYVEGMDLLQLLKECARQKVNMPLGLVLHICSEVAKALDYAHHARNDEGQPLNIIHRDVSPSNVLISKDGEVKITDFGVARYSVERGPVTRAGVLKGKMGYMSPEQVRGGLFDGRADLFSLGVVLFEAITLKRLFLGENELETLINIRDVKVEDRLKRHHELVEPVLPLLRKALHRSPDERFQRGREFHRAIQDFLFEHGMRVDGTDVAEFVSARLQVAFADPESAERYRRERLTDQELREEATVKKGEVEWAIPADATDVFEAPMSAPVITQVEIPRDLQEARQTGSHAMGEEEPGSVHFSVPKLDCEEKRTLESSEHVSRILVQLIHHRETGVLHLSGEEDSLEIFLAGGVVRTLHWGDRGHPLASYLQSESLVSVDTMAAIELETQGGKRLVDAVIQHGELTPAEVIRHLHASYERAFLEGFTWAEGDLWFERGGRIQSDNRIPVELDAAELLTEGVKRGVGEDSLLLWLDSKNEMKPCFHPTERLRHLGHREKRMEAILRERSGVLSERIEGRSRADRLLIAKVAFVSDAAGILLWNVEDSQA